MCVTIYNQKRCKKYCSTFYRVLHNNYILNLKLSKHLCILYFEFDFKCFLVLSLSITVLIYLWSLYLGD